MNNKNISNSGISLSTVLFIVFIILKLTGVISWSWWWITAPLWIPFGIIFVLTFVGVLLTIIVRLCKPENI